MISRSLLVALASSCVVSTVAQSPKNLIFMISDGYGVPEQTLTRLTKERLEWNPPVFMDEIFVGQAKTHAYLKLVTESAAAATSLSCGIKTIRGYTGVDHEDKPCKTLLEALRDKGYKTGTVSTSRIQDATIAAFTAHAHSRHEYGSISIQQIEGGFDLLLGGGYDYLVDQSFEVLEGRDMFVEASELHNFTAVDNAADFRAADSLPLLGVFTQGHMSQEIDRDNETEPSIFEMVTKAVNLLHAAAQEEDTGFMLLIEGSNIDKRWHECDSAGAQYDALMYDDTLRWVADFAKETGDTLVISTSDHECGGVAIGNVWDVDRQDIFPEVFDQIDHSALYMAQRILNDGLSVTAALNEGLSNLADPVTAEEIAELETQISRAADVAPELAVVDVARLSNLISRIFNNRLNIGCLAGTEKKQHTGENVPIFGYGPGADRFGPVIDNTDIANTVAELFGIQIGVAAFNSTPGEEVTTTSDEVTTTSDVDGTSAPGAGAEEEGDGTVLLDDGIPSYAVALILVLGVGLLVVLGCWYKCYQPKESPSETHRPLASRSNSKEQLTKERREQELEAVSEDHEAVSAAA